MAHPPLKRKIFVVKNFLSCIGGGDNLHFLDFGHTQPTVGAKHKINDFCFLDFSISMKNTPYQGQKTIFHQFEQCGIIFGLLQGLF